MKLSAEKHKVFLVYTEFRKMIMAKFKSLFALVVMCALFFPLSLFAQEPFPFPSIYFTENIKEDKPHWVPTEMEAYIPSILLNSDILAYYGHPNSRNMGILGRFSIPELDAELNKTAAEYRAVSGGRYIKKAFYIIYGTVWPGGDIGILGQATLMRYIEYAMEHDILVFIDHQIGRFDPVESVRRMFPYLRYPNVHLAFDPEWRTERPMKDIGHVTGSEINRIQRAMEDYMIENNIPGERMLVTHQFNINMIRNREQVRSNFNKVRLVHCADGFGPPHLKRDSYAVNARATNMPIKGFKLFYNFNIPGAGYDNPLMTPQQVYGLTPRPYVIMYQ